MARDLVVIGASAGGVEALQRLVAGLPDDLPAAVLVVLHMPAVGNSVLPTILSRAGKLPARHAVSGDTLEAGRILVARPDHHLVVDGDQVLVTRGPHENGHRPAIDVLFRSAARTRGCDVVAVMLSGVLDDGTAGATAVTLRGGMVLVQDPDDALYESMPRHVLERVSVAAVAPASELGSAIGDAVATVGIPVPDDPSVLMQMETALAAMDDEIMSGVERPGTPAGFGCPDCNGSLFEITEGEVIRFRCRVGHAWSAHSLIVQQSQALDSALWMALRSLEEKAALGRRLASQAEAWGNPLSAARFGEQSAEARHAATLIRSLLEQGLVPADEVAGL
jgi:two-component system chemotaxis response regulator CheB